MDLDASSRNLPPHLLSRRPARTAAGVVVLPGFALRPGRVHEFCGVARRTLALMVARALEGPVLWLAPEWSPVQLNGDGVSRFAEPGRLVFVTPRRIEDVLWAMEEGLRAGAVPLVVADLLEPPGLTPVRRLQLAAEAGACQGFGLPLGLLLTPGEGGAPGVESRWAMSQSAPEGWHLARLRARRAPPAAWAVSEAALGLTPEPA